MYSKKRKFGNLGEDIAVSVLEKRGFGILDRNYLKKWGEIDIVARGTTGALHFIEVKSVSSNSSSYLHVPRDTYVTEENVTREKLLKLERAIKTWIHEHKYMGDWQVDVVTIEMNIDARIARFKLIENVSCT
jgi:putative endonuclease